ncbi:MAG: Fe-Mn family superoxide dismutase [Bacteroidia bacterium]|jgi:Fe-Mn family superoxide dismutase
MKRRDFVRAGSVVALGTMISPLSSCNSTAKDEEKDKDGEKEMTPTVFVLPALGYAFNALEPKIDEQTMQIHHGKHHAGYVKKLNKALEEHPLASKSLEEIVMSVSDKDADTNVRNNGGGHYNHSLFWEIMKPGGGEMPAGKLAEAVNTSFGSYDDFKMAFAKEAGTVFGSGWAWLCKADDGKLFVTSTPNQDNPLMKNVAEKAGTPILGIDVWEHAYYLKYQNKRKDYIDGFMTLINWETVGQKFEA